ncbi:MAG: hypothetical protein A2X86_21535 [Bdellovibrionales bacterium GWA2_49_15]|nr:MAG: hypothetical protein A2X86_21535 [Bdellovibrionales bacterium GWA2_49_15]HAZ14963.1 hypothetical protein [Bdellovibrionales bacterium]
MKYDRNTIISRKLDLRPILERKSCFLFGPRQTGKSTWLQQQFPDAHKIDLLESDTFLRYSAAPQLLREEIKDASQVVVIDEIQKLPNLLDEVHWLIERRKVRFVLTGSSARKLKRTGVNMLGGRARSRRMHPFVWAELGDSFRLNEALCFGLMPPVVFSDSPYEDLRAYIGDYLTQEIAAEGVTRNLPAFSRFLEVAALGHGKMINFASVASDAQVSKSTVINYYQVLEDTLLASLLQPWRHGKTRKAIQTPKIYLFDNGIAHALQGRKSLAPGNPEYGDAFESWMHHELRTWVDLRGAVDELTYWRSTSGFEVDFILNDEIAIEVKAKKIIAERDLRSLRAIAEEAPMRRHLMVCLEPVSRKVDRIEILRWSDFLQQLWAGKILA